MIEARQRSRASLPLGWEVLLLVMLSLWVVTKAHGQSSRTTPEDFSGWGGSLDLAARYNPPGLALLGQLDYKAVFATSAEYGVPTHSLKGGVHAIVSPSMGQAGVQLEYQPLIVTKLRLEYDRYRYFGRFWSLLSFPTSQADYGASALSALEGEERATFGDRVQGTLILQAKVGAVFVRNDVTYGYYLFAGPGPWFYESEHDVLLKDGDSLFKNRISLACQLWAGSGDALLIAGPSYEVYRAEAAKRVRQRLGALLYLALAEQGWAGAPHFYLDVGVNLQDDNREAQPYVVGLVGTSWGSAR